MAEADTTPDQGDERRSEAYMAAHDAFNSAVPAGLRGHSEWCDRFDAARAAFDRHFIINHPEYAKARQEHQSAAQGGGTDAGAIGRDDRPGADQRHQHGERQPTGGSGHVASDSRGDRLQAGSEVCGADQLRSALVAIDTLLDQEPFDAAIAGEIVHRALAAPQPSQGAGPVALRPYEPTEDMRQAAKRIDPALPMETIRAIWSAMWSAAPPQPVTRITWDEEGRRLVNGQLAPEHQPVEPGDERRAFDLYWLARQRQRGFGAALTDAEMLSHPEDRADEFLAWQAARALPAAGVSIEEYRRVVSRCIELGEKIATLSAAQPVAQEAKERDAWQAVLQFAQKGFSLLEKVPADAPGNGHVYDASERFEWIRLKAQAALAAPHPSQGAEDPKQNWAPYLSDRADGVRGHFAIARWNTRGYREVWNLRTHQWSAFSDEVLTQAEAEAMLKSISFAAPPQPVSAEAGKGVEPIGYFHCNGEFHAVMPADWEPSESVAVSLAEAGWKAAIEVHAKHGMAGWSSHREEAILTAISRSKTATGGPDWQALYRRMRNVAAGYSNLADETGSSRRLDRDFEAIEKEARNA